jgi:tellurite resistance protein TerC
MNVPLWLWFAVLGVILVMLAIDLVAHRQAKVIEFKEAAAWSILWVSLGIGFGVYVWLEFGAEFGQQYFSGFVIEKSLAVDNVFVWALIFAAFSVPREYQHRVLFLGVLGALVFRGIFIALGYGLISSFSWILYVFAAFLIWTGVQMMIKRNEHFDVANSKFLRVVNRSIRSTDKYYGQKFFVRIDGVLLATPLFIVLALVEFTDIIFAVDSIPAIFAVTDEPFLVFTANAFAILGLRAMYFLLGDLMHRFIYLKIGLSFILVWVGIKMLLNVAIDYKLPTTVSLSVIIFVLAVSIIASLLKTKGEGAHSVEAASKQVFEFATEAEMKALGKAFRKTRK